jgi:hypothetical protein
MQLQRADVAGRMLKARLREGKYIWLTLVVLVGFWLIVYNLLPGKWLPTAELKERIRWYGILLEIVSILSIAYELNNSLTAAGRKPLIPAFLGWVAQWRFIFIRGKVVNLQASSLIGGATLFGRATVLTSASGTTEEQLAHLKSVVDGLLTRFDTLQSKVDANVTEFKKLLERETAERANAISSLRGALEEQNFGDVRLQVAALIVLIASIFFANAPDESAILFRAVGLGNRTYW